MKRRIASFTLALFSAFFIIGMPAAHAVTASDWDAGRIIDDSVFTNQDSMSIADIQNFLNQKVGTNGGNGTPGVCDTNGVKTSELGGGSRAQYGASRGNPTPFTCLKDYYEVPKNDPGPGIPANNYGGVPIPAGAKSAANLIFDAAQEFHISPKVLLITIQKESPGPLITDDWPLKSQFTYAMGAHCPDSGPGGTANCDTNYAGFSLQIAESAGLMRYYLDNMTQPWWPYKKVGNNAIQYNPNTGCGSTNVNIQSSATAALYTYTPYQPNPAALSNMYGTGDGCSAYGNRNFWRMYNDWFGSTTGDLVRTPGNATVYLISGDNKYPIGDGSVLSDFSSLGPIRYVTDTYVNTKTTGPQLGHMVGAGNGTLYFVNAGIKLYFSSCEMVAEFGYSCGQVITLTDGQLSLLATGPGMTQRYKTTSGKEFYVDDGVKREVFDQASLTAAGISGGANMLLESGLSYMGYGAPIIRDRTVAVSRFNDFAYFYENTKFNYLPSDITTLPAFNNLPHAYMDDGSIPFVSRNAKAVNGFVSNVGATSFYALLPSGKALLSAPAAWVASYLPVSDAFLSSVATDSSTPINNQIIKGVSSGTVYLVESQTKRPIGSWDDLVRLSVGTLSINVLRETEMAAIPIGSLALGPGTLVKTPDNGTVYLIDGVGSKLPVSTFSVPSDIGSGGLRTIATDILSRYTTSGSTLSSAVVCDGKNYIGLLGRLYEVDSSIASQYALTYQTLDSRTCDSLPKASKKADRFLLSSNGTIFYVQSGSKRPITSWQAFVTAGGTSSNTLQISDYFAGLLPTGAALN